MNININQSEIVKAIKSHIVGQGINLDGKVVSVKFTAGRKDAGLTADIQIEDEVGAPVQEVKVAGVTTLQDPVVQNAVAGSIDTPSNVNAPLEAPAGDVAESLPGESEPDSTDARPLGQLPADPAPASSPSLFS